MRKKVMISVLCLLSILSAVIIGRSFVYKKVAAKKMVILIDPGHGGIDGGAVAKDGTSEKGINLSISLKLEKLLKEHGYDVKMTRREDKGLYEDNGTIRNKKHQDLNKRCEIKNDTKCDMFLSIHLNKFPQSSCKGAQVWYSDYEGSKIFAHIIQENFRKYIDDSNKRVEKAAKDHYKILRCNDIMPSVIVECGFLSNTSEEEKLKEDDYQKKIADVLLKSIDMYFQKEK